MAETTHQAEFMMGIRHKPTGQTIYVNDAIAPILEGETMEQAIASMIAEWEIVGHHALEVIDESAPMKPEGFKALYQREHDAIFPRRETGTPDR